jgi:cytochrome c oxidase subunit 4
MAHHHQHEQGGVHAHISSTATYLTIFFILMGCTILTYYVSTIDLGAFNFVVAIGIALFKAALVILYFMHVKWSQVLTKLAVVVAVVFLLILLLLTATDYSSRQWIPTQPGWEKHQVLK